MNENGDLLTVEGYPVLDAGGAPIASIQWQDPQPSAVTARSCKGPTKLEPSVSSI